MVAYIYRTVVASPPNGLIAPPKSNAIFAEAALQLWPASIQPSQASILLVGTDWTGATLAFPMGGRTSHCVPETSLWILSVGGGVGGARDVGVYASRLFDFRDAPSVSPRGRTLLASRPRSIVHLDGRKREWARWDVTAIISEWVSGHSYRESGITAPIGGPIVLEIRAVANPDPVGSPKALWRFGSVSQPVA